MAPKLINKTLKERHENKDIFKYQKIKKTINEYQKLIKKNIEEVGENFAYEARSIQYKDKKKTKLYKLSFL